jgi:hypothetical protein
MKNVFQFFQKNSSKDSSSSSRANKGSGKGSQKQENTSLPVAKFR